MVHKPKHKVHSFRGLLGDGGQDEINLERQNLNIAYRIIKLDAFPHKPGDGSPESLILVWREKRTTTLTSVGVVDFTDPELLGSAYYTSAVSSSSASHYQVVFDNILFSRNIYITHTDNASAEKCNYYIEIEEVPVTASTLMQIKLGTARRLIGAKMGA